MIYKMMFAPLLIALLFTTQCAREGVEFFPKSMVQELSILPESALTISYANLSSFRESPFFATFKDKWEENMASEEEYQEFIEMTGFDLEKDIDEIYFSISPPEAGGEPKPIFIMKGKFNPEKILKYISSRDDEHHFTKEKYGNHDIFRTDGKRMSFCFPDNSRLVAAHPQLLKNWLDMYSSESRPDMNKSQLHQQVKSVKYKNGFWVVLNPQPILGEMSRNFGRRQNPKELESIKSVKAVQFSMKADKYLRASGVGSFSDSEKAMLFRDAARGLIATAKLTVSENRDIIDVLNKINIDADGANVEIDFKLKKEDLEKLAAQQENWVNKRLNNPFMN